MRLHANNIQGPIVLNITNIKLFACLNPWGLVYLQPSLKLKKVYQSSHKLGSRVRYLHVNKITRYTWNEFFFSKPSPYCRGRKLSCAKKLRKVHFCIFLFSRQKGRELGKERGETASLERRLLHCTAPPVLHLSSQKIPLFASLWGFFMQISSYPSPQYLSALSSRLIRLSNCWSPTRISNASWEKSVQPNTFRIRRFICNQCR